MLILAFINQALNRLNVFQDDHTFILGAYHSAKEHIGKQCIVIKCIWYCYRNMNEFRETKENYAAGVIVH